MVAHFDHGIRTNSADDADFVKRKAGEYELEVFCGNAKLSASASEAEAREARYKFLYGIANEVGAHTIWTAHHLDDLVESIIINFLRGTGWRGLAVLDRPGISRPLLGTNLIYEPMDKNAILEYAGKRKLSFREDQSNSSDEYLRNRVRHKLERASVSFQDKLRLYELWQRQKQLKSEMDQAMGGILPDDGNYARDWFKGLNESVALEVLRTITLRAGIAATRPQLEDFRQAILTYAPGKSFNLPKDRLVHFTKTQFVL